MQYFDQNFDVRRRNKMTPRRENRKSYGFLYKFGTPMEMLDPDPSETLEIVVLKKKQLINTIVKL